MLQKGSLRRLASMLAVLGLCSCASYYRLQVGEPQPGDVRSIYLIVAKQDPRENGAVELHQLFEPERLSKYLFRAQYDAVTAGTTGWKEVKVASRFAGDEMVKVQMSADLRSVEIAVNKILVEDNPTLILLAVGLFQNGWSAEAIDTSELRRESGARVNLLSGRFERAARR